MTAVRTPKDIHCVFVTGGAFSSIQHIDHTATNASKMPMQNFAVIMSSCERRMPNARQGKAFSPKPSKNNSFVYPKHFVKIMRQKLAVRN